MKLCTAASVFNDEYANIYVKRKKKLQKKNLFMRNTPIRTHVYVKEIQLSVDEYISRQTKIDLDNKIEFIMTIDA